MTHIYYNPVSGNVSSSEQPGYIAFVNASNVAREKDDTQKQTDLFKDAMNALTKSNMEEMAMKEYYRDRCDNQPLLTAGIIASLYGGFTFAQWSGKVCIGVGILAIITYLVVNTLDYLKLQKKVRFIDGMELGDVTVEDRRNENNNENDDENENENENNEASGEHAPYQLRYQ